jgi:hypothetical protein
MKTRRAKIPPPEKRCTHLYPSGEQCRQWRAKNYNTCASHTPELVQKNIENQTPELLQKRSPRYKNGTKAKPLKPLRKQEDLLDHLTIRHYEIFLAAESAAEAGELNDLARLSTHLTRVTRRYLKKQTPS